MGTYLSCPEVCDSDSSQVLHIGNLFLLAFDLGCAFSPTTNALLGFRLLGDWHLVSHRYLVVTDADFKSRVCRQCCACLRSKCHRRCLLGERACNCHVHLHFLCSHRYDSLLEFLVGSMFAVQLLLSHLSLVVSLRRPSVVNISLLSWLLCAGSRLPLESLS